MTLTLLASLIGCASRRAVIVHDSDVFKVGPGVFARAYIWNAAAKQFELSANKIHYPEGWYVTGYHKK